MSTSTPTAHEQAGRSDRLKFRFGIADYQGAREPNEDCVPCYTGRHGQREQVGSVAVKATLPAGEVLIAAVNRAATIVAQDSNATSNAPPPYPPRLLASKLPVICTAYC
jgi:hypothetical protein